MALCGVGALLAMALALRALGAAPAERWSPRSPSPRSRRSCSARCPLPLRPLAGGAHGRRRLRRCSPAGTGSASPRSGSAVAAKVFPAVLLPPAFAYVWRTRGRREALLCLGVFVAVARGRDRAVPRARARTASWESVVRQATAAAPDREPRRRRSCSRRTRSAGSGSRWSRAAARRTSSARCRDALGDGLDRAARASRCSASGPRSRAGRPTPERLVRFSAASRGRLRRARQGALAAVPDLADPARAARRAAAAGSPPRRCSASRCSLTQLWFPIRYWDLALRFAAFPPGSCSRGICCCSRSGRAASVPTGRARGQRSQLGRGPSASHSTSAPSIRTPPSAGSKRTPHARPHAPDRELGLDADDRVVRAGHARVGDRGGPARLHARVVRLHVRVRSEDRRDAAVEPARHRDLLARRLGVEVDDDDPAPARAPPRRAASSTSNGLTGVAMNRSPCRLSTATGVPSARRHDRQPAARRARGEVRRPDHALGARRGRARSRCRRQTWLPSVIASAPAASSRSASRGVSPAPSATFSPLTTQKSTASSSLSAGSRSSTAARPGEPKTSARKRIFRESRAWRPGALRSPRGCRRPGVRARAPGARPATKSRIVPSFDVVAATGEPTVRLGSGRRCVSETTIDGLPLGWMSMRAP